MAEIAAPPPLAAPHSGPRPFARASDRGTFPGVQEPDDLSDAAILARFGIELDPVIEAYEVDVDRTLLRQNLARTPEERWRLIQRATRLAAEVRKAGGRLRGE